jgi:hypothetical protein
LLSFRADPNANSKGVCLLSVAASKGHPEAVQMLLAANANPRVPINPPLLAVLSSGCRLSLSLLLEGRPGDVLEEIDGKSLLWHAASQESSLLPVIVSVTLAEIEKLKVARAPVIPEFPPKQLKPVCRTQLLESQKLNEQLAETEDLKRKVNKIKCLWL